MTNPLTYEEWCGITGRRRHIGVRSYEEFKRNLKGYEAYLEDEAADAAADAAENAKQEVEGYIENMGED